MIFIAATVATLVLFVSNIYFSGHLIMHTYIYVHTSANGDNDGVDVVADKGAVHESHQSGTHCCEDFDADQK